MNGDHSFLGAEFVENTCQVSSTICGGQVPCQQTAHMSISMGKWNIREVCVLSGIPLAVGEARGQPCKCQIFRVAQALPIEVFVPRS